MNEIDIRTRQLPLVVYFNEKRGTVRTSSDSISFPDVCTVCLGESAEYMELQGSGQNVESAFLALIGVAYYVRVPINVCRPCRRAKRFRLAYATLATIFGLALGGLIAGLSPAPGSVQSLVGVALAILSPIMTVAYVSRMNMIPAISNFSKKEVEIRFRNKKYMNVYRHWCEEMGVEVITK